MKQTKTKLVFILVFTMFCFVKQSVANTTSGPGGDCTDSTNLVTDAYFDYFVDTLGSYVDTTTPIMNEDNDLITLTYNVTKVTDTANWPYLEFDFFLPDETPWKNLCAIKVVYKADHPIRVALNQPVLLDFGQSYQKIIPAATTWKTEVLYIKDFKQPDWSTHKDIALDMKNIQALSLTPDVDPIKSSKKGIFKLKEVTAFGVSIADKDTLNAPIIFYSISDEMIFLRVKDEGKYSFDVLNTNGTSIISLKDVNLPEGYNKVTLPEAINNGIYYIKISNDKESIKKLGVVGNIPTYFRR